MGTDPAFSAGIASTVFFFGVEALQLSQNGTALGS